MLVAIQPDDYTDPAQPSNYDASSPRWAEHLKRAGIDVRWVDVCSPDILEQLWGCSGFMWRWAQRGPMHLIARRLLPVIEQQLGLAVYPDQNSCWHYDDKIAQRFLLEAAGIPIPKTWIWFEAGEARRWAASARYPLVLKLSTGSGGRNVCLVHTAREAERWIDRLFSSGVTTLAGSPADGWRGILRSARARLRDSVSPRPGERHHGYALFQQFLPDNSWETRVTVIGNRAFAFRRFPQAGQVLVAGVGQTDHRPDAIDTRFVHLAFKVAAALRTQSVAIDGLLHRDEPVVSEISYNYGSWLVHDCPGHWQLCGEPEKAAWRTGRMWPEEAQIADFVQRLRSRESGGPTPAERDRR